MERACSSVRSDVECYVSAKREQCRLFMYVVARVVTYHSVTVTVSECPTAAGKLRA